jgi:hypothetical protein
MVDQALIDKIVARVLALLAGESIDTSSRNVLMLFSGASTGFVVGMEAIKRLTNTDHKLTVVMTPSAGHIITEEKIRQAGASNLIRPDEWVNTPGLVKQSDLVLVPTLSMSLAARLAQALMDSLISTLILGSLLAGKPVIAVRDGADPNGNGGLVFGANQGVAPTLRARLSDNLSTLSAYGLNLVSEAEFLFAVEQQLLRTTVAQPAPVESNPPVQTGLVLGPQLSMVGTQPGSKSSNFLTESDLLTLQPGSFLRLAPGSRLTPLAQDTARRLNLQLVFES